MSRLIYSSIYFALLLLSGSLTAAAQEELPRRGFFGAQVAPITDADRARLKRGTADGILVRAAVPQSSAEAAGIEPDDVILKIDKTPVSSVDQFVALMRNYRSGDRFEIVFARGGREIVKTVEARPRPAETHPDFDILYKKIAVGGVRRRVIVTRPKAAGKYPALLFLAGVGCYSQDNLPADSVHRKIFYHLTQKGFVTMRVEKSGMGDSEGADCMDPKIDFATETEGYKQGLKALQTYDFVDAGKIFLFGHSMGGVSAPLVAAENNIKGIIVTGTVGKSWFEYELENLRRQLILAGMPHDAAETAVRRKEYCNYRLYRRLETPGEIAKDAPDCVSLANQPPAPFTYMRQVADLNLAAEWKKTSAPVLVVYGASDYLTSTEEHRFLTDMLNNFRPSAAKYVEIAGMTHGLTAAASQTEEMRRRRANEPEGEFKAEFLTEIERWLDAVLQKK